MVENIYPLMRYELQHMRNTGGCLIIGSYRQQIIRQLSWCNQLYKLIKQRHDKKLVSYCYAQFQKG